MDARKKSIKEKLVHTVYIWLEKGCAWMRHPFLVNTHHEI
jgi:hypothetical protein